MIEQTTEVVISKTDEPIEAAKELIALAEELNKTIVQAWEYIQFPNMNKIEELVTLANATYMKENVSIFCLDNDSGLLLPLTDTFLNLPESDVLN